MSQNMLFEVTPLDGSTAKTLRMAGAFADASGTQLNGYEWKPLVTRRNSTSLSYASDGLLTEPNLSNGSISFRMGEAYENEAWSNYEWNNALGRIFVGNLGDPFSSYTQIFEGSVSSLSRDGLTATVELLGPDELLKRPMLSLEWQGTGGAEGPPDFKGKLKPRAFGYCISVPADDYLIDPAKFIYQVHGYGACSIGAVYEYAQSLGAPIANVATYAALAALTLLPGEWAKCEPQGMFRLGGRADKKVSADITAGPTTLGTIVPAMLGIAGIPAADIGSFAAFANKPWSLYQTEQANIGDIARNAMLQAGGVLLADGTGTWQCMDYFAPKSPVVLNADRSTLPLVKSYKLLPTQSPVWKVKVGYDRVWGVHSPTDVSPALREVADANAANAEAIAEARETADQAAADAVVAKERLDAMADDGKLSRDEKASIVREFGEEAAQQTGLMTQATNVDVTVERSNLTSAFNNLRSYLEGLNPAFTDNAKDTPIDRVEFDAKWRDYWLAKQTLLNKLAGVASTIATWGGVTGSGKPADNATVGAPVGTNVGGRPVEVVIDEIDFLKVAKEAAAENLGYLQNAVLASQLLEEERHTARSKVIGQFIGLKVGTAISRVEREIVDGDTALAEVIELIGAKSGDGLAFIFDSETAQVEPGKSMATRFNEISAEIGIEGDNRAADISRLDKAITDETGARAEAIIGVRAALTSEKIAREADILRVDRAVVDEVSARAEAVTDVRAAIKTERDTREAAVSRLDRAVVDEAGARASAFQDVNAALDLEAGKRVADVSRLDQAVSDEAGARASAFQEVQASVDFETGKRIADVSRLDTAIAGETEARAQAIERLDVHFGVADGAIANIKEVAATDRGAVAKSLESVSARFGVNEGKIEENRRVSSDADGALGTRIDTVQASFNGLSASVGTYSGAISALEGKASAYWQTTAVAGDNRAQLTIHADANNGAGVDIVGDVAISGSLVVSGSITSGKFAPSSVQQIAFQTTTYPISIPRGTYSGGGGGGGGTIGGGYNPNVQIP
jgi:hypothetical protein